MNESREFYPPTPPELPGSGYTTPEPQRGADQDSSSPTLISPQEGSSPPPPPPEGTRKTSAKGETKEETYGKGSRKRSNIPPPPKRRKRSGRNEGERSSKRCSRRASSSPEPNCAICLGKLEKKASTDSCLHKFCFTCLMEWSKVKAECPLCKSSFKAIYHNIKSDDNYETYTLPPPEERPNLAGLFDENGIQFLENGQEGGGGGRRRIENRRGGIALGTSNEGVSLLFSALQRYRQTLTNHHVLPTIPASFASEIVHQRYGGGVMWRRRRGTATAEFRRDIYTRNLWVDPESLVDVTGRYRECSPEWFRNNPATTHRLVPFLNRELSVLLVPSGTTRASEMQQESIQIVMDIIMEEIQNHEIRSREMYDLLFPHLLEHTEHFQREFYYYARSVYDIIGYDRNAVHVERPPNPSSTRTTATAATSTTEARFIPSDSHSSDDDDIVVVNEIRVAPGASTNSIPPPPMDVDALDSLMFDINTPSTSSGETSQNRVAPVRIQNSTSSSNDENDEGNVEIVQVVKPRHLRTPEIINISTDNEIDNEDDLKLREKPHINSTTILISSEDDLPPTDNSNDDDKPSWRHFRRAAAEVRRNNRYSFRSSSSTESTDRTPIISKGKGKGKGKKSSNNTSPKDKNKSLGSKRKLKKSSKSTTDPEHQLSSSSKYKKHLKNKRKKTSLSSSSSSLDTEMDDKESAHSLFRKTVLKTFKKKLRSPAKRKKIMEPLQSSSDSDDHISSMNNKNS